MDLGGASDPAADLPLAVVLLRPSLCEPRLLPCLPSSLFLSPGVRPPTTLLRTRRGEVDMGLREPSNLKSVGNRDSGAPDYLLTPSFYVSLYRLLPDCERINCSIFVIAAFS